jgi:hypothetical protein
MRVAIDAGLVAPEENSTLSLGLASKATGQGGHESAAFKCWNGSVLAPSSNVTNALRPTGACTHNCVGAMSAFGGKADIDLTPRNVCF